MKLGYDRDAWEKNGIKEPIKYDQRTHPSMLISGSSGSGITVHMGRATPEDWKMNFAGLERPDMDYKCGQGFVWADGYEPRNIIIPKITNMDKLISGVKNHLNGIW